MNLSRLAVVCDFPEENWPSMDLLGEKLVETLHAEHADNFRTTMIRPPMARLWSRVPGLRRRRVFVNVDRLVNRFWHYPRLLRKARKSYDLFHVVDHSYAHLAHELPAEGTGVFCHDLDAFRCLIEPTRDRRPAWFRALARRTLAGLQRASVVFHLSNEIRREIERHELVDPQRLVLAAPGVSPEFTPHGETLAPLPAHCGGAPFLLHVGSCIPRKRIDVLIEVFAQIRVRHPDLRLLQIGGEWNATHRELIARLHLDSALAQRSGLRRDEIAALYRKAALVLLPSEAEGFGLPLIEALACGAVVVASDIPVLREVGGDAAVYCPVGEVASWTQVVEGLLTHPAGAPGRFHRLAWASQYTWENHTRTIAETYWRLLSSTRPQPQLV